MARNGATIAFYANNGGNEFSVDIRKTFGLNLRYQGLLLYTLAPDLPLHRYPLEAAAVAHDAVEHGAVGKVLIDIAPAG